MASPEASAPLLRPVLIGLTAVTGLVDAVSYLGLGHVFTANMTGNVALLGFALAGAPGLSAIGSAAALLSFLAGAVLAGRLVRGSSGTPLNRWTSRAFATEAALFALAALATSLGSVYPMIVLTAAAMGLRSATVRNIGIPDLTTTVLTMTLAGLAADSSLAGGDNRNWKIRAAAVAALLAGAAAGALLVRISVAGALAVCTAMSGGWAMAAHRGVRADAAGLT
jgi:uncharacterized membrane protein YoaK (UPF0700 family)